MTLFTTVSAGRTHIALHQNYVGNVNSYNNWFSALFAKIFCKAVKVEFEGETRWVNKKSYAKLLDRLGVAGVTSKNVRQFTVFKSLHIHFQPGDLMRNHLTAGKVNKLTNELIKSLYQNNTAAAMQAVGKGADVNRSFWDQGGYTFSYNSYKEGLPKKVFQTTATLLTPVMMGAMKGAHPLNGFMLLVGGNTNVEGKVVQFSRTIEDVKVNHKLNVGMTPAPTYVYHHGKAHYAGNQYVPTMHVNTDVNTLFRDQAVQTHVTKITHLGYQQFPLYQPYLLENHTWVDSKRVK